MQRGCRHAAAELSGSFALRRGQVRGRRAAHLRLARKWSHPTDHARADKIRRAVCEGVWRTFSLVLGLVVACCCVLLFFVVVCCCVLLFVVVCSCLLLVLLVLWSWRRRRRVCVCVEARAVRLQRCAPTPPAPAALVWAGFRLLWALCFARLAHMPRPAGGVDGRPRLHLPLGVLGERPCLAAASACGPPPCVRPCRRAVRPPHVRPPWPQSAQGGPCGIRGFVPMHGGWPAVGPVPV